MFVSNTSNDSAVNVLSFICSILIPSFLYFLNHRTFIIKIQSLLRILSLVHRRV
ncbi:hypothetical protein SA58113_1277 [Staphylococcus argenteus]|nr:hypothetical protein SA58113_1277 [Staphylococcus argenteus]